jgi:Amt family ammonium transporter
MTRAKAALNMMMMSFISIGIVGVVWVMWGASMSSGEGFLEIVGNPFASFGLIGVETTPDAMIKIGYAATFAIITVALISGAIADRAKFGAWSIFVPVWVTLVYCPLAYMVWGGGLFGPEGAIGKALGPAIDFAGGTVVHINAGVAGLMCAIVLGKRKGYGTVAMAPHNLTWSFIGASLLWVGWFGFNAGSAVASNALAGAAMINTQVATAAAALAWMFAEWIVAKKPSLLGIISGAVAGLVAITPASGFVNPTGALIIGIVAGVGCYIAAVHVKKALGYDDSLDAFGVHGIGGIIGALLTGVFADTAVNELGKDASLVTQAYGVIVTIVYTAVASLIILYVVKAVVGLRPSIQEEEEGLDITQHG